MRNYIITFFVFIILILVLASFLNVRQVKIDPVFLSEDNNGKVLGVQEVTFTDVFGATPGLKIVDYGEKEPRLREGEEVIVVQAAGAAAIDIKSNKIIFSQDADRVLPIASITKLITALIFLEYNPGWDTTYKIRSSDRVEGGRIYLSAGEEVEVRDLFYSSLVGSANTATRALVSATGLSEEDFVGLMNKKMEELGLVNTKFFDPIGLSTANVSTSNEIVRIASIAFEKQEISDATLTDRFEFNTVAGKKKIVENTDILLDIFPQNGLKILGGKTGFTNAAGYCFTGKFTDLNGHEIVSVVLGGSSYNSRFRETRELIEWIYRVFEW
jgi:D-alanyl-D-alanine carboxypeptidase